MRKILIPMVLLALALAACGGGAVSETVEAVPSPSPLAYASQAVTPAPSSKKAQVTSGAAPAGCTVVSPRPTPGATEQSLFPPIRAEDWTQGPSSAAVTLLEYSDFQ